jgi:2-methylcitrate dehydratase
VLQRVIVNILTTDGRSFDKQLDYPKGDPRNPLSDAEIEEKFAGLADGVLSSGAQKQLKEAIWNLDKIGPVSKLMALVEADVQVKRTAAHPKTKQANTSKVKAKVKTKKRRW